MNSPQHNFPNGLFVLRLGKEETLAKVEELSLMFMRELKDKDAVKKCKEARHRLLTFLEECFFPETCGVNRSMNLIKGMDTDNATLARTNGEKMYCFLVNLKLLVDHSFLLSELPSCRALLDDTAEVAAQKALDIINNNIVTGIKHGLFIGKDIHDLFSIADVKRFYQEGLGEFENEKAEGWTLSPPEQILERKFLIENKYCDLAALHVAGRLTKELYETERIWIEEQEQKMYAGNNFVQISLV
jgi:hypothetical protein